MDGCYRVERRIQREWERSGIGCMIGNSKLSIKIVLIKKEWTRDIMNKVKVKKGVQSSSAV